MDNAIEDICSDFPDLPDPIQLVEEVPAAFRAESGSGSPEDPIIIKNTVKNRLFI